MTDFQRLPFDDIDWDTVRVVTVVPFLDNGDVVLVDEGDFVALPSGDIAPGEDALLDTVLRVALECAGFRRQGTNLAGILDGGRRAAFWVDGFRYLGERRTARRDAIWWTGPAEVAAKRLAEQGDAVDGAIVQQADRARNELSDDEFYEAGDRLLTAAYLRAATEPGGSGFGGDADEWRAMRSVIVDAIDRDGTFLDVGCANGLLMETVQSWAAERAHHIEPFGLDYSNGLVAEAQRRLPRWADRVWVGNALTWVPPDGRRFDFVHTLLDLVPIRDAGALIAHLLDTTVADGGRLIVSEYGDTAPDRYPAAVLSNLGYRIKGVTRPRTYPGRPEHAPSAWVVKS